MSESVCQNIMQISIVDAKVTLKKQKRLKIVYMLRDAGDERRMGMTVDLGGVPLKRAP